MAKDSSLDQIKNLIRRWESSGLSKSSFCRDQHMSYHKFNYWQKRWETPVQHGSEFNPVVPKFMGQYIIKHKALNLYVTQREFLRNA